MRVTIQIIARANMVAAVNAWLRNNLGATGDNVGVPLIGINDPDTAEPTHYGCNWAAVEIGDRDKIQTGVVNSPHVTLYTDRDFYEVIAEMGLRVKPSDALL